MWMAFLGLICGVLYSVGGLVIDLLTIGGTRLPEAALLRTEFDVILCSRHAQYGMGTTTARQTRHLPPCVGHRSS